MRLRQLEADEKRQQQNNMTSQQEALTKALTDSIAAQNKATRTNDASNATSKYSTPLTNAVHY